ncbi:branched-chain amino acid transporter AzlC [Alteromonas mediterranea]|uniref:Branched-chain amino acid transporter AzlC n=2 Tax=Alteromonas mediterranea TaxID=314275 RepID=A0AAC9NSZ7_9ALTE|nr:AzlC family ABC transporter permease [Alteromonas mediterranea]AGP94675.1 putative amino acid transporter [Alteromonas mediterranea U8]MBR9785251.1 AzlC family ABC transporter permease [Gammaproteobacteria bacterium]MDY6884383.1 AzlC family ABC transporter permease [Pseudomonadota bacterium]AEA99215.1 branched-chain amino acid permease [Alteromonas mediterranea DE]AGP82856.1 putative amino acid transporter [Alteromonas mediterranea MED64]|tara:strand:- start:1115 stop:1837 length:723 start_codon:yes stop_codon:yes gene_type:complete
MSQVSSKSGLKQGIIDGLPLLGGYIPVAISFGVIAIQAGFSTLEATLISVFIYAGASQFLLVAMVASGAPLWLAVCMTLLVNVRHVVYAPNLVPYLPQSKAWPYLMHGLTDQIFALAHTRLPSMEDTKKVDWFKGVSMVAWFSWILGTALGGIAGDSLTQKWPILDSVMPFALPALFVVLLAPKFSNKLWSVTLLVTISIALFVALSSFKNAAIPLAALCGALTFYLLTSHVERTQSHAN